MIDHPSLLGDLGPEEPEVPDDGTLRVRGGVTPASEDPIAAVLVETELPHLARAFDYAVPETLDAKTRPGVRVRVRFAGRLISGFVLARKDRTDHVGELAPIERVVSTLEVLTPSLRALCEEVAARYAGTLPDVLRLAVPPRHAKAETTALRLPEASVTAAEVFGGLALTASPDEPPDFHDWLHALGSWGGDVEPGTLPTAHGPRAAMAVVPGSRPGTGWVHLGLRAATTALAQDLSVLWLVPDYRELELVLAHLDAVEGLREHTAVLTADQEPAARWTDWVRVLTGRARLVVGTRAAAFAPLVDPGLLICFDDDNDSYLERRSPYPHARQVLLTRAQQQRSAVLLLDHGRSVDVQRLVDLGWAGEITVPRDQRRASAPVVLVPDEDAPDLRGRIPGRAFELVRAALGRTRRTPAVGPVLVQVPRAGYLPVIACARCREIARCPACGDRLTAASLLGPFACRSCGHRSPDFRCAECGHSAVRSVVDGLEKIHEELGRAFPGVPVRRSGGHHVLQTVPPEPSIVVATTGAEPYVAGGYAVGLLLDTLWPGPHLRATDAAISRRLRAASLVRSSAAGGRVLLLDEDPAVQKVVSRFEPIPWAREQVHDRTLLGLPPATRTAVLTGERSDVDEVLAAVSEAGALTPLLETDDPYSLVLSFTIAEGPSVTRRFAAEVVSRSMRQAGRVHVRIDDPDAL